jgi:hypothetical protein
MTLAVSNISPNSTTASSPRVVHLREALHSAAAELEPGLCVVAIDLHRGLQPGHCDDD